MMENFVIDTIKILTLLQGLGDQNKEYKLFIPCVQEVSKSSWNFDIVIENGLLVKGMNNINN